jgi:hypothetical protein
MEIDDLSIAVDVYIEVRIVSALIPGTINECLVKRPLSIPVPEMDTVERS